jgi:hypothetical protein
MAESLRDCLHIDEAKLRGKPMRWPSEESCLPGPSRSPYSDGRHFFPPADAVILYVEPVRPDRPVVDFKGRPYLQCEGMRDPSPPTATPGLRGIRSATYPAGSRNGTARPITPKIGIRPNPG